jgi:hypothetical protein
MKTQVALESMFKSYLEEMALLREQEYKAIFWKKVGSPWYLKIKEISMCFIHWLQLVINLGLKMPKTTTI